MTDITLESMDVPLIYRAANAEAAGFVPPDNRHGQSARTWVRSLEAIQKEALVTSAMTGLSWRFASDEGPHLQGRDQAPNPLSFLSVGMVSAFMNEIMALAAQRECRAQRRRAHAGEFLLPRRLVPARHHGVGRAAAGADAHLRGQLRRPRHEPVAL